MSELNEQVKAVTDLLKEAGSLYDRPKIDYYEFRNKWLPLFNADSNDGLAPLGEWVQGICRGNGFLEVDVIKDGNKVFDSLFSTDQHDQYTIVGGEYMFTVPAILNRGIEVKLSTGKDIGLEIANADRKRQIMAKTGETHFTNEIKDKLKVIHVDPELSSKMDAIFEHFGVKRSHKIDVPSSTEPSNHTAKTEEAGRIDNDSLNFDDW